MKKEKIISDHQLRDLVDKNFIEVEQAKKISVYYKTKDKEKNTSMIVNIFITIGAILVGIGIITFFSMNWQGMPRLSKLILAIIPTLIGIVSMYFILEREEYDYLKIALSAYLPLAITGTLVLINQIYQLNIELGTFLLNTSVCVLPFLLMLRTFPILIIYLIYSVVFVYVVEKTQAILVLGFIIPLTYLLFHFYKNKKVLKTKYIFAVLSFLIGVLSVKLDLVNFYGIISYIGVLYLLTIHLFGKETKLLTPLRLAILFSLVAETISTTKLWETQNYNNLLPMSFIAIKYIVFMRKELIHDKELVLLMVMSDILLILSMLSANGIAFFSTANILIALWSILKIRNGYKMIDLQETTDGVLYLILLILFRFFSSDLNFSVKSVIFIVFGIIFIVIAQYLKSKFGELTKEKKKAEEKSR